MRPGALAKEGLQEVGGRVVRDHRYPVHEAGLDIQGLVDGSELLVERHTAVKGIERVGVPKATAIGMVLGHVAVSLDGNRNFN